ncbi:MAG: hypothetical protein V1787_00565 [Candidatus Micrarchaeota archaeon]
MSESGLITKKVPRRIVPKIRRLQANYMLRHRRRISEAEIIEKGVEKLTEDDLMETGKKSARWEDFFGMDKSRTKGDSRTDVDKVVYGI